MGTDLLVPIELDGGECPASTQPEPHRWIHNGIGDSACGRCGQQVLWDPTPEWLDAYWAVAELITPPRPAAVAPNEVPASPGLYAWYCDYRLVPHAQPRLPEPGG